MLKKIAAQQEALLEWAASLPYFGVLVRAAIKGQNHYDKDMAASVTYYTFLSLFPLLLGLAALGGYFLKSADLQARVNDLLVEILPVSNDFVARNIESLINVRGAAGVTSIVVLLWSGSKMVSSLNRGINRALGLKRPFTMFLSSLRSFCLTLVVASLVFLTMAMAPLVEVLAGLELDFIGESWNEVFDVVASRTAGLLLTGSLVSAVYFLLPYERQPLRNLLPGLALATVIIEAGKQLFTYYVVSSTNYSAVYGSVSSIIVLLLWLYFSARVILYGAELIGVLNESTEEET